MCFWAQQDPTCSAPSSWNAISFWTFAQWCIWHLDAHANENAVDDFLQCVCMGTDGKGMATFEPKSSVYGKELPKVRNCGGLHHRFRKSACVGKSKRCTDVGVAVSREMRNEMRPEFCVVLFISCDAFKTQRAKRLIVFVMQEHTGLPRVQQKIVMDGDIEADHHGHHATSGHTAEFLVNTKKPPY